MVKDKLKRASIMTDTKEGLARATMIELDGMMAVMLVPVEVTLETIPNLRTIVEIINSMAVELEIETERLLLRRRKLIISQLERKSMVVMLRS